MSLIKSLTTTAAVAATTLMLSVSAQAQEKIEAVYIPLADHYPAIIAYEKYRSEMKEADYTISLMKSWPSLKGKFMAKKADLAMIISPMAMNMRQEDASIKWISLIHRTGNALALNDLLATDLDLSDHRSMRKPTAAIAEAFANSSTTPVVGVPSLESTHTLVMYKYLKDHGYKLAIGSGKGDVIAKAIAPPKSPDFLMSQNARNVPAAIEQSLPWADVVETQGKGKIAWYSKDVLPFPKGHVECIIIAQSDAVNNKQAAVKEVIHYIHKAGQDIEDARRAGPEALKKIAAMVRKHIPGHSEAAILASLSMEIDVISYKNLNVDKAGLKQIMDLALEAGVMKQQIDIDAFADTRFSTKLTDK